MKRFSDIIFFLIFLSVSFFFWLLLAIVFLPLRIILKKNIFNTFSDWLYELTVPFQRREIIERIKKGSRVLDVGSGNGYLAKAIAEIKEAKVTCADVEKFHRTDLPFKLFNGHNLPFEDKMFDFVVLSYVLHHSQNQESLFAECARVCGREILVLEDEPVLAKSLFAKAHGVVYNFLYNLNGKVTYHSPQEWKKIFKKCGLKIVKDESSWGMGSVVAPMKRVMFVLKPY